MSLLASSGNQESIGDVSDQLQQLFHCVERKKGGAGVKPEMAVTCSQILAAVKEAEFVK